jgi:excisionase family DNA binding protein
MERWLTVQQVCDQLQVSDQTVRRWIKAGSLAATNLGGKAGYRIREADLNAFLEQMARKRLEDAPGQTMALAAV